MRLLFACVCAVTRRHTSKGETIGRHNRGPTLARHLRIHAVNRPVERRGRAGLGRTKNAPRRSTSTHVVSKGSPAVEVAVGEIAYVVAGHSREVPDIGRATPTDVV